MKPSYYEWIAHDLNLEIAAVQRTAGLLETGATIPFIARYRKEVTHGLDETQIRNIQLKATYYAELLARQNTVLTTIRELGKLTGPLADQIMACRDKQQLEDLYLPYKPKRSTRDQVARDKGLLPLSDLILKQATAPREKQTVLARFINPDKGVTTLQQAISGAQDIISQTIADTLTYRQWIRRQIAEYGRIESKVKKEWAEKPSKYDMYYHFSEPLARAASHRLLALRRAQTEKVITLKIGVDDGRILDYLKRKLIHPCEHAFAGELIDAIEDAYKRLLYPSLSHECFELRCEQAEAEAIQVFAKNLENLLLAAPAGPKRILGVDPGFRNGCKLACIDETGSYLAHAIVYPHAPQHQAEQAKKTLLDLIMRFGVDLIAIGNGTASKETDLFVHQLIKAHNLPVIRVVVSEAGASVYSASELAGKEFPGLDVTIRGAISIARRLQDPLAELIKIDPKAIGVGQYQHDVNPNDLMESLAFTTDYCVNHVGVDLNTASAALLAHVAGIGPAIAANVIRHREKTGPFKTREALLAVEKIGPKIFQQCAGFLRIKNSTNPLDNSGIHPESYPLVKKMAKDLQVNTAQLIGNALLVEQIELERYQTPEAGMPTLLDIRTELLKPGLDPRDQFTYAAFRDDINDIGDLKIDMVLEGVITNVTKFGAFVDIGVHQDGLIHISNLSDTFVKDPHDIVSVGQRVRVDVRSVDPELKRIGLRLLAALS